MQKKLHQYKFGFGMYDDEHDDDFDDDLGKNRM